LRTTRDVQIASTALLKRGEGMRERTAQQTPGPLDVVEHRCARREYLRRAMSYAGGIAALRSFSLLCWLVVSASVPLLIVGGIWSQSNPPKEGWKVSVPPQDVLMTDRDYKNTRPVRRDYIPYALRQGYRRATHDQATDWLREQAFTPRTGPLGFTPMGLVNFGAIGLL